MFVCGGGIVLPPIEFCLWGRIPGIGLQRRKSSPKLTEIWSTAPNPGDHRRSGVSWWDRPLDIFIFSSFYYDDFARSRVSISRPAYAYHHPRGEHQTQQRKKRMFYRHGYRAGHVMSTGFAYENPYVMHYLYLFLFVHHYARTHAPQYTRLQYTHAIVRGFFFFPPTQNPTPG